MKRFFVAALGVLTASSALAEPSDMVRLTCTAETKDGIREYELVLSPGEESGHATWVNATSRANQSSKGLPSFTPNYIAFEMLSTADMSEHVAVSRIDSRFVVVGTIFNQPLEIGNGQCSKADPVKRQF